MTKLAPFADDSASLTIGGLTVENGTEKLVFYGNLDITRDKPGLDHAKQLITIMQAAVQALGSMQDLPEKDAEQREAPKMVKNPFA